MIDLTNINKIYKRNKKQIYALRNVSLHLNDTGFVCITGPSGSGKTTLLNLIYGSVIQTSGEINHNNIPYNKSIIKKEVSYIFQEYNLIDDLNVYDNINLALKINGIETTKEEIDEKLNKLGLNDILSAYPFELSGGQQQRVAIARASLINSNIILADEPTGALDDDTATDVMNLLKEESKNKLVIVVSHNKELVKKYADQLIEIKDGEIVLNEKINEDEIKLENEVYKKKKTGFKYLFKLGLKYINFKSFKMYLSFVMMVFSFTLLILSVAFILSNPEKTYNSLDDKKYNYTVIKKYKKKDSINTEIVNPSTKEMSSFGVELDKLLIYNYSNYAESYRANKDIYTVIKYNDNVISSLNYKLVGDLPNENEALITKRTMDELGETDYTKVKILGFDKVSGYIEIDYEKEEHENFDLNDAIYVNDFEYDYLLMALLTEKMSYEQVQKINDFKCEDENYFYKCNSPYLSSLERAISASDYSKKIIFPLTIVLITLTILLLINYVFSVIEVHTNDAKIVKMIGGNNKKISILFGTQPFLMITISLMISFVLYFIIKENINFYLFKEFQMLLPVLFLTFSKIIIVLFGIVIIFLLSIIIPIRRIKYIK